MLKFDPDEDDEDGTQSQATSGSQQGAQHATSSHDNTPTKTGYNCPNALPPGQDSLSPLNATPNPAERGNFPYTQQDTRVRFKGRKTNPLFRDKLSKVYFKIKQN